MPKAAIKYPVDGQQMTVREAAALVGVTPSSIYNKLARSGESLQNIVSLYRVNLAKTKKHRGERYFIDGEWLTLLQVAERLGIKTGRLQAYLWRHKDAKGIYPSLSQVVEKYRRGEIRERGGYNARIHKIGDRYMTAAQAATACGVKLTSFRVCVMRKGSMEAAVAFYEKKREKQARDEILRILGV